MQDFIDAARHAADVAAAVIRPFFRQRLAADQKSDDSPVTIADRAAEQAMRAILGQRFPEHGIQGEEFGLERPDARHRWVLDPIDGTRAFITGRPVFGTLIALLEDGIPILGVIDQPITGERWIGVRGHPTLFQGAPASTRSCNTLGLAELSCTAPEIFDAADRPRFARLQAATRRTTWGGDCYAYGLVALGGIDVIAEAGLKIWDWAAIVPIIEGAGGSVTDWTGAKLHADGDGKVLALGDSRLLPSAAEHLRG